MKNGSVLMYDIQYVMFIFIYIHLCYKLYRLLTVYMGSYTRLELI